MGKKPKKKKKQPPRKISGLKIQRKSIDEIAPHPQNVRLHDEENIAGIVRSIEEFGQQSPLVINQEGLVLKGNGTLEALGRLDYEFVDVVVAKGLTKEQELAFAIADNKTGDTSSFDFAKLADVIKGLDEAGFDLGATGFQDFELEPLMEAEFDPGESGKLFEGEDDEQTLTIIFPEKSADVIRRAFKKYQVLTDDVEGLHKYEDMIIHLCRQFTTPAKKKKR